MSYKIIILMSFLSVVFQSPGDQEKTVRRLEKEWQNVKLNASELEVARFIGYTEGCLDIRAPENWANFLLESINHDGELDFFKSLKVRDEKDCPAMPSEKRLVELGIVIPKRILDEIEVYRSFTEIAWHPDNGNIFVHVRSISSEYGWLFCFSPGNKHVNWAIDTAPKSKNAVIGGIHRGGVGITSNRDSVFVLTRTAASSTLISFAKTSGKEQFRAVFKPTGVRSKN